MPEPHRLSATDAHDLLARNFGRARRVATGAADVWRLLDQARAASVTGGRTYDFVLAAALRRARPLTLLTWNVRHLAPFADARLTVASPVD